MSPSITDCLTEENFSFSQLGIKTDVIITPFYAEIKIPTLNLIYDPEKFKQQDEDYFCEQLVAHEEYESHMNHTFKKMNSVLEHVLFEEQELKERLTHPSILPQLTSVVEKISANLPYLLCGTTYTKAVNKRLIKNKQDLKKYSSTKKIIDFGKSLLKEEFKRNPEETIEFWLETQNNISDIYFKIIHNYTNIINCDERMKNLIYPKK